MTTTLNAAPARRDPASRRVTAEILTRLNGPGGYYNVGNLIGLCSGLALQFAVTAASGRSGADIVVAYFVGSPATLALTIATLIFLVSGEMYHRAWRGGGPPDARLNRLADLLSAAGAVALAISLLLLGQPLLALFTGLLTVFGKLGSAVLDPASVPLWPAGWPDPFRTTVLVGRFPAVAAAVLGLWRGLDTGNWIGPAVLVLCNLLWMRADYLLFAGSGTSSGSNRPPRRRLPRMARLR